ncbi:MAG TPA: hypothetical protein VK178_18375 [Opitutaceae bacterium]|nr:hypothetical protein [Opitutaceae bacterium]
MSRLLAQIGIALQLAILVGMAFAAHAIYCVFSADMPAEISQGASIVTEGVARALWSIAIGQSVAVIGIGMMRFAVLGNFRAPWFLKWGRRSVIARIVLLSAHPPLALLCSTAGIRIGSFPWIQWGIDIVVLVQMLRYFAKHRAEYGRLRVDPRPAEFSTR